jgi:uroporphyrin-III C-methyltransferase
MSGHVSLIGAGPGDPELLTVRAVKRLAEADVVLYDALVDRRVLDLAHKARCVDVGKRCGKRQVAQAATERLLVRLARRGWKVVRLKGGDPFVFGRGGEEALTLSRAGISWDIVPGLSSALVAPALCGIPVTHRGLSASLLVTSGHDVDSARTILSSLIPLSTTVVILMARQNRAALAQILLSSGWPLQTPATVIQSASLPDQTQWLGTLFELQQPSEQLDLADSAASLLVIGKTVALSAQLLPYLSAQTELRASVG